MVVLDTSRGNDEEKFTNLMELDSAVTFSLEKLEYKKTNHYQLLSSASFSLS
jgi:hypothetical protein